MKLGTNSIMSVVVPVYNEEVVLPALKERLLDLRRSLPMRVRFILVNDGSTDRTGALLDSFVGEAEGIQAVHLSRNFGHQQAVSAGLSLATGDCVAVIDGPLLGQNGRGLRRRLCREAQQERKLVQESRLLAFLSDPGATLFN